MPTEASLKGVPRLIRRPPKPGFGHYFAAAAGSVAIGVTLPSILVWMRSFGGREKGIGDDVVRLIGIQMLATVGCSPGAVLLAVILFANLSRHTEKWTLQRATVCGALFGILIAFLNLPGYLVFALLNNDPNAYLRVGLLFTVAGASCGMWIAWHAWRAYRPEQHFVPRFSLKTLLLIVFLWGFAMLAFQPDQNHRGGDFFDASAGH